MAALIPSFAGLVGVILTIYFTRPVATQKLSGEENELKERSGEAIGFEEQVDYEHDAKLPEPFESAHSAVVSHRFIIELFVDKIDAFILRHKKATYSKDSVVMENMRKEITITLIHLEDFRKKSEFK